MAEAFLFAAIASSALLIGAGIGVWKPPPRRVTALLLAFASGALITAVAFELFEDAYEASEWRAAVAFLIGATVFVLVDMWLERGDGVGATRAGAGASVGFALLAGVTLDGVPENLALGVSLIEEGSLALLAAIFASNLPEAIVGATKMRESGIAAAKVLGIWAGAAALLAAPVLIGYGALEGVQAETLAWRLGFAAGAVLASLAETLMPEAFAEGGPSIAFATAMGFLLSFLISMA